MPGGFEFWAPRSRASLSPQDVQRVLQQRQEVRAVHRELRKPECPQPWHIPEWDGWQRSAGDSGIWGMLGHTALGEVLQEKPTWSAVGDLL